MIGFEKSRLHAQLKIFRSTNFKLRVLRHLKEELTWVIGERFQFINTDSVMLLKTVIPMRNQRINLKTILYTLANCYVTM